MEMTRRGFLGSAAGFAAVGGGLPCRGGTGSVYRGVPIGVITYSYRSMKPGAGKTLEYVLGSDLSTIELMSNDVEIEQIPAMMMALAVSPDSEEAEASQEEEEDDET